MAPLGLASGVSCKKVFTIPREYVTMRLGKKLGIAEESNKPLNSRI